MCDGRLLEVAGDRNSPEVAALFEQLFDHVQVRGGRLSWGRSVNPGVSGWYPVGGEVRPVWTASTGVAGPDNHPYLYFWFLDLYRRVPDRLEEAFRQLERISSYRDGLVVARSVGFEGTGSTPSVLLDVVLRSKEELSALFAGIEALSDPQE